MVLLDLAPQIYTLTALLLAPGTQATTTLCTVNPIGIGVIPDAGVIDNRRGVQVLLSEWRPSLLRPCWRSMAIHQRLPGRLHVFCSAFMVQPPHYRCALDLKIATFIAAEQCLKKPVSKKNRKINPFKSNTKRHARPTCHARLTGWHIDCDLVWQAQVKLCQ